jgi:antitoxin YefM
MANVNATQARKEFFNLIKEAVSQHTIFRIHHRQGNVVLMSDEEYESIQETLDLLAIPGFRESIKKSLQQIEKGKTYSMDEVFGEKVDAL